ncbi:VWA domain-containing protein [Luteimonas pelagia]
MPLAMDAIADLHLLRPQWLWALLAIPVLAWWWRARRQRAQAWRGAVDAHLLPHLLEHEAGRRGRLGLATGLLAYALAVVALAGPSWRQSEAPLWQSRAPLVVALDLSSAITATDLPPSRLLQARAKLADLLTTRTGGEVGLVVYSGDAFTVAPLTDDARNVALFLDALEPSVMPLEGDRPDRAIAHAADLLAQAGFDQGDILLMAGGADAPARDAARDAAARGYRVSALGLGTPTGSAVRTGLGAIEQVRLDVGALQSLATTGGGTYATITPDAADLRALGVLDPREAGDTAGGRGGRQWQDQGYWLLPPLMLLALFAFRRGGGAALVVLCLALPMVPVRAAPASVPAAAPSPVSSGWWLREDQQRHRRMQRGIDHYRAGEHDAAAEAFAGVDTADGHYNRGNALAKAGKYRDAIAAYDAALERAPGMPDAVANRAAVQALLDRKPPPGPNDSERGDGEGQGGDAGQPSDRGEPGSQGDGGSDGEPQSPPGPAQDTPGGNPAEPAQDGQAAPEDPGEQAEADAAQRARMREAMERQQAEANAADTTDAREGESPEARERRLANEAWLRRVPDDPGGLLRRRFALEYERRLRDGDAP